MNKIIVIVIVTLIVAIFSFGKAEAGDTIVSGSFIGGYTGRFMNIKCDPKVSPIIFYGWVELTGLQPDGVVMFGLVDKEQFDNATWEGDSDWGSGAYTYFSRIGNELLVGPSDGFWSDESNQIGAVLDYEEDGSNLIEFSMIIYADQIIVTYNGTDYENTYGDIEDANVADNYTWNEFDYQAYAGFDSWPHENYVNYEISISGCVVEAVY